MSGLRDVVFALVWAGLIPASFIRPWIGILAWSWIAYMVPHGLTWGFGRTLPVAIGIGGATLLGLVLKKDTERRPLPPRTTVVLLFVLCLDFTMTTLLAHNRELSFGKYDWVMKSILMAVVTILLFQKRERLRWLFLVMAVSLGFWGAKGGLWVLRTGGGERVYGPDMSFFGDNNTLGLALCMALPLLLYVSREEKKMWVKWVLRVVFSLTIIAIIFTYSRGAFLGLGLVLGILIWKSPWRLRFAVAILVAAFVVTPLLPDRVLERFQSIKQQTEEETADTSVQGRFQAWRTGWNMATDRPFTGAGFRAYWNDDLWDRYHEGWYFVARDAHSLYFEVLGEHGFLGFGLYMAFLVNGVWNLWRMMRRWRGHAEYGYLSRYAEMILLALVPYLVAGAFIGVAYFDLYFHLMTTGIALQALSAEAARVVATRARPAPATTLPAVRPARGIMGTRHA